MSIDTDSMRGLSSKFRTGRPIGGEIVWDMGPPTAGPPAKNPWSAGVARRATRRLVDGLESRQAEEVSALFAEHAVLTLGNNPPIVGRAAIKTGVEKLFRTVKDLRPRIVNTWHIGADTLVEVTCDPSPLSSNRPVNGALIWRAGADGLIEDLRIHIDLTSTPIPARWVSRGRR